MSNMLLQRFILVATVSGLALLAGPSFAQDADSFDISSQIGPDPVLPEPKFVNFWPSMKLAEVVGWEEGQTPQVPEGLAVTAYATDLVNPRTVHTLPNGDVLVVQSRGPTGKPKSRPKDYIRGWVMSFASGGGGTPKESNLITLLRDTDRDGTVDERSDLLTDLASPFGIAWIDDTLYVAATDGVLAYPFELGQTQITEQPTILTPLPGGPINHHWTKDLALSPDGTKLFASVGSNSNIAENGIEAEKGRAAIWEIDRATGASRIYASGLRNANGLTFHPDTGTLFAVINERDELGPNLVPDYMTSVQDGGFYGWPWSYYGDHVDARVHPLRSEMVEAAIVPDYALSSHVAPLGMTFSNGSAMPEEIADGAFIGERGSWNRDAFNGYKVVYVPFENGKPAGMAQDIVTGFLSGDQAQGRPVGLGIDGTGALLVADDAGSTVWRVANADGSVTDAAVGTDGGKLQSVNAAGSEAGDTEQSTRSNGERETIATDAPEGDNATAETPLAEPQGTNSNVSKPSLTDIAPAVQPESGVDSAAPSSD